MDGSGENGGRTFYAGIPAVKVMDPAERVAASDVPGLLTRSDILLGTKKRHKMPVENYGKDVIVRPLSEGEICLIFDAVGGIGVDGDGFPDTSELGFTGHLGLLRRVAQAGLVEPELELEDVGAMPFGVPGHIAGKILQMSGLSQGASGVVESFRDDAGGTGAAGSGTVGDEACQ